MKILVVNQPLNNRGDEAAHKALIRSLLSLMPEAYITVLFVQSYSPDGIRQFAVDDDRIVYMDLHPQGRFWKLAEEWIKDGTEDEWDTSADMQTMRNFYEGSDFVVCAPGGICMGAFQDWWHLFYLKFARHLGKPLIYYGRSFGPFPTETSQNIRFKSESMELLRSFSFLSIRDKQTEAIASQIEGLKYHSTTDVAFLEQPHVEIPQEISSVLANGKYMVFVPNYLLWHPMYKGKAQKDAVVQFYCDLIDVITEAYPELRIVMLPQTFGSGTYEGDDVFFFREIAEKKQDIRVVVIADIYSSDIQQTIISESEFLIGARYHSVVFAINQNIPFIALSYEHKIHGLLSSLDKLDCMVDITNIFADEAMPQRTLQTVRQLISQIRNDERARRQATAMASECLGKLVGYMRQDVSA